MGRTESRPAVAPGDLRDLVALACRAPSVHNTQPWRWRIEGHEVRLYADRDRQLLVADPDGRNLLVSCGAALHHAVVAAAGLGLTVTETARFPDPADPDHLATLTLDRGLRTEEGVADLRALEQRRTDRRRFTSWPIPEERLAKLAASVEHGEVHVLPLTDVSARFRVELLVSRAASVQDGDAALAEEQRHWINRSREDGIPADRIPPGDPGQRRSRFAPSPVDHRPRQSLVETSDGLLAICTDTDDPAGWLRAGEALSELWLHATTDGLSVVPLSQVIEVDETRATLRHDVFGGLVSPQILLRIGWQEIARSELGPSPRRPVEDVLEG